MVGGSGGRGLGWWVGPVGSGLAWMVGWSNGQAGRVVGVSGEGDGLWCWPRGLE